MVTKEMLLSAQTREVKSAHLRDLSNIEGQLNLISTALEFEGVNGACFDDVKAGISILHLSIYEMMNTLTDDSQEDD